MNLEYDLNGNPNLTIFFFFFFRFFLTFKPQFQWSEKLHFTIVLMILKIT